VRELGERDAVAGTEVQRRGDRVGDPDALAARGRQVMDVRDRAVAREGADRDAVELREERRREHRLPEIRDRAREAPRRRPPARVALQRAERHGDLESGGEWREVAQLRLQRLARDAGLYERR